MEHPPLLGHAMAERCNKLGINFTQYVGIPRKLLTTLILTRIQRLSLCISLELVCYLGAEKSWTGGSSSSFLYQQSSLRC